VNVAAGFVVLLNCATDVLGPLATVQAPVPITGVFAAKVAKPFAQMDCGAPALAVVGGAVTVMVTLDVEGVHGALLMVHVKI
jgi:hypothetical protein